jgi:hypothetical protein
VAHDARHDPSFGEIAVMQINAGARDLREVSAYSTVFPEFAWGVG